jgi:D-3-phosphoglycerate dehydrogenase
MKVLANDGIHETGKIKLEKAGATVHTDHLGPEELLNKLGQYDVLCVRSATKVTKEVIDAGTSLKIIARGGVGMDNIDIPYAESKGIKVVNTPAASSNSVAELVFGHLLNMTRFLAKTNRVMPEHGATDFKALKKACSKGTELNGKTLGIIGIGRIGKETARIAVGMGMNIMVHDPYVQEAEINVSFHEALGQGDVSIRIKTVSKEDVLKQADFLTLHIPGGGETVIGEAEIQMMKKGSGIVNCARGGVVDEKALKSALDEGHLAYAALDVFEKEPPVYTDILKLENVSLSPHIGAATVEAQERIGLELADHIISTLGSKAS